MTSERKAILSHEAPKPLPIYSQAIAFDKIIFCSGQTGMDPATSKLVEGEIEERTKRCLENLDLVLKAANSSLKDALKVTIYLTDMSNFARVNNVYETYFGDIKPARTCVAVYQLPLGTDVEIECFAASH